MSANELTPVFPAKVSPDGRLNLLRRDRFEEYLKGLTGKRVEVIVRPPKTSRSARQNRYYWGVVVKMLVEETGHDADEVHEHLKWRFLRLEAEPEKRRPLVTVGSTMKLSTAEFETFCADVRMWAAQFLSVHIPLPNEVEDY